jgi:parafibromin
MSDPLSLLRDCLMGSKPIRSYEQDLVFMEDKVVSKDVVTNYRSKKGTDECYTLGAVWFCVITKDLPYTDYLSKCTEEGIPRVSLIDRKSLIQYMIGETNHIPYLDLSVSIPSDWIKSQLKASFEDTTSLKKRELPDVESLPIQKEEDGFKKIKLESSELTLMDLFKLKEKVSKDHLSILRNKNVTFQHVLTLWKDLMTQETKKPTLPPSSSSHSTKQPSTNPPSQLHSNYNRYEVAESDFWKERIQGLESEGFQIDTKASYLPHIKTSTKDVISSSNQEMKKNPHVSHSSIPSELSPSPWIGKESKIPIILIPAATTSLLTLYNAKTFFEKEM